MCVPIQVMANLNFQQPPRSIANSSINNRGSSFVGSGTSSLSGHVTPTSGMFPQSNASFATQSQLSPNRSGSVQLGGGFGQTLGNNSSGGAGSAVGGNSNQSARANLFGQRIIADRRQMPSLGPAVCCQSVTCAFFFFFFSKFLFCRSVTNPPTYLPRPPPPIHAMHWESHTSIHSADDGRIIYAVKRLRCSEQQ